MKHGIFMLLAMFSLMASAQNINHAQWPYDSTGHIAYSQWISVPGAKAGDIYNRAADWLTQRSDSLYTNYPVDKESGKLVSKSYQWFTIGYNGKKGLHRQLFFTVTITPKDGGYQFLMNDFYLHYEGKSIFSENNDSALETVDAKNHDPELKYIYFSQINALKNGISSALNEYIKMATSNEKAATDSLLSNAQWPYDSTGHIAYSQWISVPGAKAGDIYNRAADWLTKRSDSLYINYPVDKENGNVMSKSYQWFTIDYKGKKGLHRQLFFTLIITPKDGGYQFLMNDFYLHYDGKSIFSENNDSALETIDAKNHDAELKYIYFSQITALKNSLSSALRDYIKMTPGDEKATIDARLSSAGDQLIWAAHQYYTGLGMNIAGGLAIGIGVITLSRIPQTSVYGTITYSPSPAYPIVEVAGGLLALVGTIEMIDSYSHINKAGRILKLGSKADLTLINTNGIGLSLNF